LLPYVPSNMMENINDNDCQLERIDAFLKTAHDEFVSLSVYCNALSSLSHIISDNILSTSNSIKPKTGAMRYQSAYSLSRSNDHGVENATTKYYDALEKLRLLHRELTNIGFEDSANGVSRRQERYHVLNEMKINHLNLSTRVLHTCCSSSAVGFGPFHQNGILKNLIGGNDGDEEWHRIRIVALSSMRSSISRFEVYIANLRMD